MSAIAEEGRLLVVLRNRLGVEIDGGGPVMLLHGRISLQLERSGRFEVGRSHWDGGRGGSGGNEWAGERGKERK